MNLGWIGTGKMGTKLAGRLLDAGYSLFLYNRTRSKAQALAEKGNATVCDSPAELSRQCDVIFLCLTDEQAINDVLNGENGVLSCACPGQVIVEMSAINPSYCMELRELFHSNMMYYLDAPAIGSTYMIESGQGKVLSSGDKKAFDQLKEHFSAIGQSPIYMGSGSQARYMKIAVDMIVCSYFTLFGEVLLVGEGVGFSWQEINSLLENSLGANSLLSDKGTTYKERIWSGDTALTNTAAKTLGYALKCASSAGFSLPLTSVICQYDRFMHHNNKYQTYSTFGTIGVLEDITSLAPKTRSSLSDEERNIYSSVLPNVLIGLSLLMTREAITFCRRADIDKRIALNCLGTCHGSSRYFQDIYTSLLEGYPKDSISIEDIYTDLDTALEAAEKAGLFVPIMSLASQVLSEISRVKSPFSGLSEILL